MFSTIFTQIVIVCLVSFGIGTLMEWYKKKLRKDQAVTFEIRAIALVLSFGLAALLTFTGIAYPVFATFFKSMSPVLAKVLNVVLYGVVIFVLQLQSDMKLLKSIIKLAAGNVDLKDVVSLVQNLKKTTGVKPSTIAQAMVLLGITEDDCIKVLVEAGITQEDATKIMNEVMKALNENTTKEEIASRVAAAYVTE